MRFRHLALVAAVVTAGLLTFNPLADGQSPTLSFVVAEGDAITVPPNTATDANDYDVRCPRNYIATGHGLSLGATQLVFADPDAGGKGFSFSFVNTQQAPATNVSASVICVRGRGLRVRAASLSLEDRRQAVEQARRSLAR
jgi:hypothetical protein